MGWKNMFSQNIYKYIWGCYKPSPLSDSAPSLAMQILLSACQPYSWNFKYVSQKEYQTGNISDCVCAKMYRFEKWKSTKCQNSGVHSVQAQCPLQEGFKLSNLALHLLWSLLIQQSLVFLTQMAWCVALHVLYNVLSWPRQMLWANGRIIETGNYHNTTKDVALH